VLLHAAFYRHYKFAKHRGIPNTISYVGRVSRRHQASIQVWRQWDASHSGGDKNHYSEPCFYRLDALTVT
jgi:hypothetical protein